MNILQNIKITGEVFSGHAFLSYVLSFESQNKNVSAEYVFSLPEGAQISAFKICVNGKIINSKVVTASHASMLLNGRDAYAVLKKVNTCEYMLTLGALNDGKCDILLTAYVPLNKSRMILPLTKNGYGNNVSQHKVSICLNVVDGNSGDISSPTHNIIVNKKSDGCAEVSAENIAANRDFCLDIKGRDNKNSAVLVEGVNGGEMLCRVCLQDLDCIKPKKLLLIFDMDCGFSKGESQLARSFVYYGARSFDGSFAVMSGNKFITDGFIKNNDENINALLYKLSDTEVGDSTDIWAETNDAVVVCVTNSDSVIRDDKTYCVSVGNIKKLSAQHIYPDDNIPEIARESIEYFVNQSGYENIRVNCGKADAEVISISEDGAVTAYVRYAGVCPDTIEIVCGNAKTVAYISNIKVYKSYSPLRLVYADKRIKQLEKRLLSCSVEEIQNIREDMERIGIKYSALNTETALAAAMGGVNAVIKTIIPSDADNTFDIGANATSMFRETQSVVPSDEFAKKCADLIVRSIRADGAICADGETDSVIRNRQTEICLMALIVANVKTYEGVMTALENKKTDIDYAKGFLTRVFGEPTYIPEDTKPDLLTAARALWQWAYNKK